MTAVRLSLRELSVELGGREVVSGLSLDAEGGTLLALVGPNGAGKTSALRAISGLLPHGGTARLDGRDISALPRRERARRIAYLPQGHEAHWPLPARDIVGLGRVPHGVPDPTRLSAGDAEIVADAMRQTDTDGFADRPITELSGGERARVALARVFAVQAPVVLADEPTAALDPRHQLAVLEALRRRADTGALVIIVTHDLGLAARFSDKVAVLDGGKLAAFGPPSDSLSDPVVRAVFGIEVFRSRHRGLAVVVPWS